ncbi:MAG: 5-(carboxyamino)imidazole ribonucleotide mutase [Candidatus Omnitrophica bacterium]|nr:5-(carboxyamino)imidazole ribonucleotide mutase [Candidatus Omnitrophota bacterium]
MKQPVVSILMGSDSDWPTLEAASKTLKDFGVAHEVRVLSAHRSPAPLRRYLTQASRRGIKVFIAGAGGAAHLGGVVAAHTTRPVIAVPIETKSLKGLDSLLSMVQMPSGVPVATVAIGHAANAALLAVQILSIHDGALQRKLLAYKRQLTAKNMNADRSLQAQLRGRL